MNSITALEELLLLKRTFCEFFNKLLPTIKDPSIQTRQRWHQFRNLLLDEYKSPQDLFNYVKDLNFNVTEITVQCKTTPNIPPEVQEPQQPVKKVPPMLGSKDVFVKRPSTRKISIKNKEPLAEVPTQQMDQIQRVDYKSKYGNVLKIKKPLINKDLLVDVTKDALQQFRKDGQTIGMVYSKSFEINTSEFETEKLTSFGTNRLAQQDLQQLQNAQRNMTLKGYSIYARKDKEDARQKFEEMANSDKKKIYYV